MDAAYKEMETVPEYDIPIWQDGRILNKGEKLLWGNSKVPPPAIGTRIYCSINSVGYGEVLRYFTLDGFIGLLVKLESPPDWYIKQNGGNVAGHVFGPEFRMEK